MRGGNEHLGNGLGRDEFSSGNNPEKQRMIICDKCGESGLLQASTFAELTQGGKKLDIPCQSCGDGRMKLFSISEMASIANQLVRLFPN